MENNFFLFILQIGILLFVSLCFRELFRRFNIPSIVGELLVGIVLGPSIMKRLIPSLYYNIFSVNSANSALSNELSCFTQLCMLLFMFLLGLQVDLKKSANQKKTIILISLFSIIIPMLIGVGGVLILPQIFGKELVNNDILDFSFLIGVCLSISALPVILKILIDLNILNTEIGSIIVSSAISNDLIGWTLFAVTIQLINQNKASIYTIALNIFIIIIFFFILILLIMLLKFMINKFNFCNKVIGIGLSMSFVIIAIIAKESNIHPFFVAFIIGIIIKNKFYNDRYIALKNLNVVGTNFLAPLYFATIGLRTDYFSNFDIKLVISIIFIAVLGKFLGAGLGALLGGMSLNKSLYIGLGMNARGSIEIIIASIALELNMINQKVYVSLVTMAIVTSIISCLGLKILLKVNNKEDIKGV